MSPQGSPSAGTTLIRISPPGPYRRVARTSIGRKSTEPRSGRVATDSKSPPIVAISPQGSPSARIRPRRGQASNILQEKHGTALETKVPEPEDDKKDEPKKEDRVMEVLETIDDALEDVEDLVDAAKFGPYPESSTMITQESIDNLQSTSTGNLHLGNAFIGNEVLSLGRHSDSIVDEKSSLSKRDLISCSTERGMNDSDDECCSCDKPLICLAFLCDCFGI
ncbi:hypothetical protein QAD02_008734 [Eretmocerus hayati]|uniref:Uncharacterized protein n=1 Tax=Eretmocerus hayati TaxID=131215 RepID=A0ACC2N7M4_9HYME|nr:hypothetical protein QAD02_008734 [Eretmocerus hayati]